MRACALLLALLAAPLVSCYPSLWVNGALPEDILKGAALTPENCILHPKTKEAGHAAPVSDKAIAVTATDAAGKPVKVLCPGVEHTVTVKYPEARRTLLTTTQGAWATANATCLGRMYTPKGGKSAESFTAVLTIPCNTTAASTILQVTSASSPSSAFKLTSMQMNIAALDKCPASTCEGATNATAVTEEDVKLASNLTDAAANASAPAVGKGAAAAPAPAPKSAAVASSPFSMLAAAACLMAGLAAML